MSTHHIKRIGIGLAAGFVLARLFSLDTATDAQNTTIPFNRQTQKKVRTPTPNEDLETLKPFQSTDFYRIIIEYNLFRPLGWRPPRPVEPYRLIGTILPRSENIPPTAIIQSTAGNKTYIVTTGETLDALTEVVSIESKQVTLSCNGAQRTLKLPSGF
ncbi:hypothetical protein F4054_07690 [Candidatus Poribacteria bacterium]|nr:hypothetical protein [Candidatus Poribacteria bacterium]MYG09007.1 hypothetical protein [Candidatus Poribacteria bacterium]MYK22127.1 hypothetical protein [Candidatus Poribacteria bacterium]